MGGKNKNYNTRKQKSFMLLHTGYTSNVASKQLETQQESDAEQLESDANAQAIQNETKAGESRAAGGGCCLRTFILSVGFAFEKTFSYFKYCNKNQLESCVNKAFFYSFPTKAVND